MQRNLLLCAAIILLISQGAFAQPCGYILDSESGLPVAGAVVSVSGNYAVSDAKGFFTFRNNTEYQVSNSLSDSDTSVSISHISYSNKEVVLTGQDCQRIYVEPISYTVPALSISAGYLSDSLFYLPGATGYARPVDRLKSSGYNVMDALDAIPGMQVQRGALNTQRMTVRGIGSRSPFSSNRIKAYFGGIPISGGDGETEIEDFDLSLVNRIELIKGPKSALYGAGLGGTVFLHPDRYLLNGWHGGARLATGSDGLLRSSVKLSQSSGNWKMLLAGSTHRFDGWRDNSEYRRKNAFMWQSYSWNKGHLDLLVNYRNVRAEIPSSLSLEDFVNVPGKAADNWASVSGFENNNKWTSGLRLTQLFSRVFKLNTAVFYQSYSGNERRPFNTLEDSYRRWGTRSSIAWTKSSISLRTGLELMSENYEWMTLETLDQGAGAQINHYKERRLPLNLFFQGSWQLSELLLIESGVSYNRLDYTIQDKSATGQSPDKRDYSYEPYMAYFSGFSYSGFESAVIYASAGNGFSYPSLQETLLPGGALNPGIRPETGFNAELGGRVYFFGKRIFTDLCFYQTWVRDMLLTRRLPDGDSFGENGGKARYSGVEWLSRVVVINSERGYVQKLVAELNANYSINRFTDFTDEKGTYDGLQLPGIPRFQALCAATMSFGKGLELRSEYRYQSAQYLDDFNALEYPGFGLLATSFSWQFEIKNNTTLELAFSAHNITDSDYASMILVNAPSFGGNAPRYYYPGQPSNFTLDIHWSF